ncbi:putative TRAPP complex subunit trs31 [Lyophyllum shimeji]|uniref:TRAPP complex subunit trs31 n=1 Tax=Lyophyllum shimeji TaxID=47721 RepID=A0A9P3PJJ6_LYOSH|nr:putative TRAPP complex subunit trs31 [Lyophyllum shimeji]
MAYAQPHPRLSVLSNSSQASSTDHLSPTTSSRFSLPTAASASTTAASNKPGAPRPNIYDRNLNKTRVAEVSASAFAFLFSEVVQYTQKRVSGINDLERRLNTLGYRVGMRVLELMVWRAESSSKTPKREIRFLPALMSIHTQVWKAVFGKPADAIEKSVENADEYMIIDNDPPIERHISVPRDMSQLSCSSFTAGIVEAVMDGLGFPARVTAHNTPTAQYPSRTTILIKLENAASFLSFMTIPMVKINTLNISPPLINSSCAWASDLEQLTELYNCPYTGAVTTRTATLDGFQEGPSHTVAFSQKSVSSINSYGYSPHPLAQYLKWVKELLQKPSPPEHPRKPFIISITSSDPEKLRTMVQNIQVLRGELNDSTTPHTSIAIELNTSCPNIPKAPPTGYAFPSLIPLLTVLQEECAKDPSLTIGLKLPPFVYRDQFLAVIDGIKGLCPPSTGEGKRCPFAFFTCTNTLGNSLLFADQATAGTQPGPGESAAPAHSFAVPTGLGGLAGEALHALALGNVYTFAQLLREPANAALAGIAIIGVGGVTSKAAADRMRRAGAAVVGCATLLGKEGVRAFEIVGGEQGR